jgi:hypothetical protein
VQIPGAGSIHIRSGGVRHVFELPSAEVASLVQDLSDGLRAQHGQSAGDNDMAHDVVLPSVLTLSLMTLPIATMEMTDYPDGLLIEIGMDTPGQELRHVRLPMFADTARAIIGALRDRLTKMGQLTPPTTPKPS